MREGCKNEDEEYYSYDVKRYPMGTLCDFLVERMCEYEKLWKGIMPDRDFDGRACGELPGV